MRKAIMYRTAEATNNQSNPMTSARNPPIKPPVAQPIDPYAVSFPSLRLLSLATPTIEAGNIPSDIPLSIRAKKNPPRVVGKIYRREEREAASSPESRKGLRPLLSESLPNRVLERSIAKEKDTARYPISVSDIPRSFRKRTRYEKMMTTPALEVK